MQIIRTIEERYKTLFSETACALNNAFMIIEDDKILTYEFEIINFKAIVKTNTDMYLEEVIDEFHFFNGIISEYEYKGKIIKTYPQKQIIRLPIYILQPSQFYINKKKLDNISSYMVEEEIYIPVALINDEYVILDGHTRVYSELENGARMVNCFIDDYDESISDFVYFAKEQNITNVSKMKVISEEQYKILWDDFCDAYFLIKNS